MDPTHDTTGEQATSSPANNHTNNATSRTNGSEETDEGTASFTRQRNVPNRSAIRHSSAYVRNYRLSRYRNALKGALPFRLHTMRSCGFVWCNGIL